MSVIKPVENHIDLSDDRKIPQFQNLSVDEQVAPYKGQSSMKQYLPNKPKKWGYKFFVLADNKGMIYNFIPYTRKIEPVENRNVPDLKASSNVVLHLAQTIPPFKNNLLFCDNWFTSLPLFDNLASRGIWSCGTIRENRLTGLPKNKISDKDFLKKNRGYHEERKVSDKNSEITYVKWLNSKNVHLVSTFARVHPVMKVKRYDKKSKTKIDVALPDIVRHYNSSMGGVDLANQLLSIHYIIYILL